MLTRRALALLLVAVLPVVTLPGSLPAQESFVRGDVSVDGSFDISDPLLSLTYLFDSAGQRLLCKDAADMDDSGKLEITDSIASLSYLFLGGPPPAPPFPDCGTDSTDDALTCKTPLARCILPVDTLDLQEQAVYFVVDRSGSMQNSGVLQLAKREISRQIRELPEQAEFGVFFIDQGLRAFPDTGSPAVADEVSRAAAIELVEGMPGGAGACLHLGLLAALETIAAGNSQKSAIVYIGDGSAYCGGQQEGPYWNLILEEVRQRRTDDTVIHAIGVLGIRGRDFLGTLTEESGGTFIEGPSL